MDLSVFDARYNNDETGAAAIHPKILLKVILVAYSKGMLSSRQIERACQENIIFIALSYGYAPDQSTIAAFISSMQSEIQTIFSNIQLVCEEMGLLGGTHFSLDGVKLSANVSKEWSGTFDELKRKRDKLQEKLQQVIAEHAQADQLPEVEVEWQKKRQRRIQLQVERLNEYLQTQEAKLGSEGKEIQSNVIDNESVKMLDGAKKNVAAIGKDETYFQGKQLTADSNYHTSYAVQGKVGGVWVGFARPNTPNPPPTA